MTYSIDDVMPGDVVTFDKGEEGMPGFARTTYRVVGRSSGALDRCSVEQARDLIGYGWRLVDVQRREPINWVAVPTDALLDLLAVWDDQSGYIQGIWRRADEEHPRTALRAKVAAFIDTTRAEWDRAGIEP